MTKLNIDKSYIAMVTFTDSKGVSGARTESSINPTDRIYEIADRLLANAEKETGGPVKFVAFTVISEDKLIVENGIAKVEL
jgi:hypothetical protein